MKKKSYKKLPFYTPTYLTKYNLWDSEWLMKKKPKEFKTKM